MLTPAHHEENMKLSRAQEDLVHDMTVNFLEDVERNLSLSEHSRQRMHKLIISTLKCEMLITEGMRQCYKGDREP